MVAFKQPNSLRVTPSFQIIFKLIQSCFQRFVGGENLPDSKSLTVWYALSHMRRMTAARQKVLIGDDVGMKWTQSDEELQNFLSRANNLHPSIKFTHEISNTTISFLDTSSSLSEGVL
jgi:hypothetical protein